MERLTERLVRRAWNQPWNDLCGVCVCGVGGGGWIPACLARHRSPVVACSLSGVLGPQSPSREIQLLSRLLENLPLLRSLLSAQTARSVQWPAVAALKSFYNFENCFQCSLKSFYNRSSAGRGGRARTRGVVLPTSAVKKSPSDDAVRRTLRPTHPMTHTTA